MTTAATREKRAHVRVAIRAAVTLAVGGTPLCGWVQNLSAGGMYVTTRERYPVETEVRVRALIRVEDQVHHFRANAWIARVDENGMGIQFDTLGPPEMELIERLIAVYGATSAIA